MIGNHFMPILKPQFCGYCFTGSLQRLILKIPYELVVSVTMSVHCCGKVSNLIDEMKKKRRVFEGRCCVWFYFKGENGADTMPGFGKNGSCCVSYPNSLCYVKHSLWIRVLLWAPTVTEEEKSICLLLCLALKCFLKVDGSKYTISPKTHRKSSLTLLKTWILKFFHDKIQQIVKRNVASTRSQLRHILMSNMNNYQTSGSLIKNPAGPTYHIQWRFFFFSFNCPFF